MSEDYQTLRQELDKVLGKLQQTDLDIDEAIKLHEHGTKLVAQLQKHLKTAENKIAKVRKVSKTGKA